MSVTQLAVSAEAAAEIARLGEEIAGLQSQIDVTERLPVPYSEALRRVQRAVAAASQRFKPGVGQFMGPVEPSGIDLGGWFVEGRATALLAAAAEDVILQRMTAGLKAAYEGVATVSDADRAKRLSALRRQLHESEVAEERLIRRIEDGGGEWARRSDASPEIVLATELQE